MAAPRQVVDHSLNAKKGWLPGNPGSLDKKAKLSANVTIDPVFEGRVVHLNSSGEFEMGCTGTQMAIFLLQNSDDPDVYNEGGTIWEADATEAGMSGLVAKGDYELQTTEFDGDQTYVYNQLLRAVASNTNATTGGRLTNQSITLYTNAVCGVVSKPAANNAHKKSVLTFWPVYLPGTD